MIFVWLGLMAQAQSSVRIGVMLPLHDIDGDGRRMTEYYRGLLMACDSLRKEGVSTDVHAWNVPIDGDIRQVLLEPAARQMDIIVGPLYTTQENYLADFCQKNDILMVIPFSISGNSVNSHSKVFQVYQSPAILNERAIDAFMQRFRDYHAVFIDCNDTTSQKGIFTFGVRGRLEKAGLSYNITNLKSSEEYFAKAFSRTQPSIVVLNTGRSPELGVALTKLDGIKTLYPDLNISLFGYTEWLLYTKVYINYFHKYETYIPTTFYYNATDERTKQLERNYRYWFRMELIEAQPRFALTGFDHSMYFIRGIHKYGKAFLGDKAQNIYEPLQTRLRFAPVGEGRRNNTFMLVHYKKDHGIEAINY